jgi:hypothetical protein
MHHMSKRAVAFLAVAALGAASLTGCSGKATEQFKDAARGTQNSAPADTVTFPDGFSNASTKCDHGNRIYVLFHGDDKYGSLAVVPGDPTCK